MTRFNLDVIIILFWWPLGRVRDKNTKIRRHTVGVVYASRVLRTEPAWLREEYEFAQTALRAVTAAAADKKNVFGFRYGRFSPAATRVRLRRPVLPFAEPRAQRIQRDRNDRKPPKNRTAKTILRFEPKTDEKPRNP